jgi:hypothetical protein
MAYAVILLALCALYPEYNKHSPQLPQLKSLDVKNDLISSQPRARAFTASSHKILIVSEAQAEACNASGNETLELWETPAEAFNASGNGTLELWETPAEAFNASGNGTLELWETPAEAFNASGNGTLELWETSAEAFHVPPNMIRTVSKKDPLQSLDSDTTAPNQEDPLLGSEVYIFFFSMHIFFMLAMRFNKNGLLIACVVYTIQIVSLYCNADFFYVMVIFSFFTALVLGSLSRKASFFRATLTSYSKELDQVWSMASSTHAVQTMDKNRCREEIVSTIMFFVSCVHEVESQVWDINITEEKNSFMKLVEEINKHGADFGDRVYYGRTYGEVYHALCQCVNQQEQRSADVEEGIRQLPRPDVSGPQVAGNPHPPVSGVVSPVPSVRSVAS